MKPRTTSTSSRSRLAAAALLVIAVVAGWLLWRRAPAEAITAQPKTAAAREPMPIPTRHATIERVPEAPSEPVPPAEAPPAHLPRGERLTFADVDNPSLYGLPPKLLRFVNIQRKAVRSQQDIAESIALASDRGLIEEAARDLGRHDPSEQQALARRRHITLVDFLIFALAKGSESGCAARAIGDIVAHGANAEGEPPDIRKSFAGDRIELINALRAYAPAELDRLNARVAGTPAEKLIAYAARLSAWRGERP